MPSVCGACARLIAEAGGGGFAGFPAGFFQAGEQFTVGARGGQAAQAEHGLAVDVDTVVVQSGGHLVGGPGRVGADARQCFNLRTSTCVRLGYTVRHNSLSTSM